MQTFHTHYPKGYHNRTNCTAGEITNTCSKMPKIQYHNVAIGRTTFMFKIPVGERFDTSHDAVCFF
jgi:hypothetical protein